MVLFLLNLVFLVLSLLLNVVSRLIFTTAAHLLVLTIQAFKLPGQAIQGALEQLGNVIRVCLEYLVELGIEATTTLISSLFDLVKDGVSGSAAATGSAIGGLMENTRASFDSLIKDFPVVFEGFTELLATAATDQWNNCKDAIGYILENL